MKNVKSSKILGIGTDIVEIERIRSCFAKHGQHMLSKLFTKKEQSYCLSYRDPTPHLAGRFSAKESIVKALGTGLGKNAGWLDIEILQGASGKPTVQLSDRLLLLYPETEVLVSISHCHLYATAYAIWLCHNAH